MSGLDGYGSKFPNGINVNAGELFIDDVAMTSTAAELNILDGVTATATELNKVAGVTAGTATASKAAVLGANKNLDVLAIADGGLSLGAGAGTAITATAAELNLLDGSVAGTAVVSKAAVLGANKNLDVLAVADLKLGAGAGTSVTATAAEINLLAATDRLVRTEVVALAAVDTAGGVFAWTPGAAAIIQRVFLDVTTKATGACTVDVGVAANATTLSDILIDGVDVGTAAGLFSNLKNAGTNGKADQRCGATQYVTGSVASGASAGIVGNAYIEYILV